MQGCTPGHGCPPFLTESKMKVCTSCKIEKPLDDFHNNTKGCKDGKQSRCKPCQAEATRRVPNRSLKLSAAKYGLTVDTWNDLFNSQDGCCDICGVHQSSLKKRLSVDHNHETGVVRSMLCQPCNWMVGWTEMDESRLDLVKQYLRKHNEEK